MVNLTHPDDYLIISEQKAAQLLPSVPTAAYTARLSAIMD